MIAIIFKIIFFGSLTGMGFIVLQKTGSLRALSLAEEKKTEKKENIFFPKAIEIIKAKGGEAYRYSTGAVLSKIFYFKKTAKKQLAKLEKKEPNLSEDYWENLRKGK